MQISLWETNLIPLGKFQLQTRISKESLELVKTPFSSQSHKHYFQIYINKTKQCSVWHF